MTDHYFQIRKGSPVSKIEQIFAVFQSDQPVSRFPKTTVADYTDDKAIISVDKNPLTASAILQSHLNAMSEWYKKMAF